MDWFLIILLVILIIIAVGIDSGNKIKKAEEGFNQFKKQGFNFQKNFVLIDAFGSKSGIAIDQRKKSICVLTRNDEYKPIYKIIPFADILIAELYEDGQTITKTSRTSQAGGAIIGTVLFGGIGTIIGGLSGKQISSDEVSQIDIRLTINDMDNPILDVNFLNQTLSKKSGSYVNVMKEARTWHAKIKIAIQMADQADNNNSLPNNESFDMAHETDKISYLLDKIGTREKYHTILQNNTFNKIEKDILLQASVNIKNDYPKNTLVERAYNILSVKKSEQTTTPTNKPKENTIKPQKINKDKNIQFSLADEILKLKSLKEDGIISEEDFLIQKDNLLNKTHIVDA